MKEEAFRRELEKLTPDVPESFHQSVETFLTQKVNQEVYETMELKNHHTASGEYWIVGVVEDDLYIIVTTNGDSGYAPQEWFWEGNG